MLSTVNAADFFRIRELPDPQTGALPYLLEVKESHSGESNGRKKKGIHPAFAVEIDAASMGKAGPQAILNGLRLKYQDQAQLLGNLPTRSMVKNLYQWASLRLCQDEKRFFNSGTFDRTRDEAEFNAEPPGVQNEMLVLECF
ncbi:hypothetical protein V7S43_017016 [Phytophthora oleae]|uniref:Uncharacterized protein n=1 Tax=Phytophthora oleae TaxID=2107226 RepID=A0ABD3EW93_9STRA